MTLITLPCGFGVLRTGTELTRSPPAAGKTASTVVVYVCFFVVVVVAVVVTDVLVPVVPVPLAKACLGEGDRRGKTRHGKQHRCNQDPATHDVAA